MESVLKSPTVVCNGNQATKADEAKSQLVKPWLARMAMSEMTTIRWSLLDDVAHYRAEGIEALSMWRRKVADFGEERAVELIRDSGLTVASLSSAGGFTGHGGHSLRSAIDDAREALRLASNLQAGCLVVVAGSRAGHTQKHVRKLLRDALVEVGDMAAQCNVPLALLPMHPLFAKGTSFLTSLDETLDVLHDCQHPFVGLAFDLYQLSLTPDLGSRVADALPWIKTVQLSDARATPRSDNDRLPPGEGVLPVCEIIEQLEAGGYQGHYDLEIWSDDLWKQDYVQVLQRCRDGFQRLAPIHGRQPLAAGA